MRLAAGQGAGPVGPVLEQLPHGPQHLLRAGGAGQVLAGLGHLQRGWDPAMGGDEPGLPRLLGGVDLGGAAGELAQQLVGQPDQCQGRVVPLAALAQLPAHGQATGQLVGQQPVVQLADRDRRRQHRAPVQTAPGPVGALDLVGDHQVGVQVRVVQPGVDMLEPDRDQPARPDLPAPGGAEAGAHHRVLHEVQGLGQGGAVGGHDGGARRLVAQRPQHRRRLRHREHQVKPRDRRPTTRPLREPDTEGFAADGVAAVAEQPGHRLGGYQVAGLQVTGQAGQAVAVPAARRHARRRVVVRQLLLTGQLHITGGDLPRQVLIPIPDPQHLRR